LQCIALYSPKYEGHKDLVVVPTLGSLFGSCLF
jgi:hypothetical protein